MYDDRSFAAQIARLNNLYPNAQPGDRHEGWVRVRWAKPPTPKEPPMEATYNKWPTRPGWFLTPGPVTAGDLVTWMARVPPETRIRAGHGTESQAVSVEYHGVAAGEDPRGGVVLIC